LFADLSFVLFLFFQSLRGLFFALDVEFCKRCVFGAICLNSGFSLGDIDVVYQIESFKYSSVTDGRSGWNARTDILDLFEVVVVRPQI
jgi:hypothetical protein